MLCPHAEGKLEVKWDREDRDANRSSLVAHVVRSIDEGGVLDKHYLAVTPRKPGASGVLSIVDNIIVNLAREGWTSCRVFVEEEWAGRGSDEEPLVGLKYNAAKYGTADGAPWIVVAPSTREGRRRWNEVLCRHFGEIDMAMKAHCTLDFSCWAVSWLDEGELSALRGSRDAREAISMGVPADDVLA